MEIYQVGGSVRDALLGLTATDRDFVVVGATVEAMLAQGYVPVGKDFPVFLHPQTQEEYALARTERKSGRGYKGFIVHAAPEVTLEEDLARRDLTINAMALDAQGRLVDPYGGQADLAARRFRHVSPAFVEDPLRVLRLARFAARFTDFTVAPETLALCRELVNAGELQALVAERVWVEMAKGLLSQQPSRMFAMLADCGALRVLVPEWAQADGALSPIAARAVDAVPAELNVRYAVLCGGLSEATAQAVAERWRVPLACAGVAALLTREWDGLAALWRWAQTGGDLNALNAEMLHDGLLRADGLRRPERLREALQARAAWLAAEPGAVDVPALTHAWTTGWTEVERALTALKSVDAAAIAQTTPVRDMPHALRTARITALQQLFA